MLVFTLPINQGELYHEYMILNLVFYFVMYGWHYWANLIAIFVVLFYLFYGVETTIYAKEPDSYMISTLVFSLILTTWYSCVIQCFMSAIGYLYVEAEIPRSSNQILLNNLDEGVYIMDETESTVMFHNKAADRVNRKMMENGNTTFFNRNEVIIDKTQKLFAFVDTDEIFSRGGRQVRDIADELTTSTCELSLEEIMSKQLADQGENDEDIIKRTYKVKSDGSFSSAQSLQKD